MKRYIFGALQLSLFLLLLNSPVYSQDNRFSFRYYSDYLYISDFETTEFGEIIWFWQNDVLDGPLHSNSNIGLRNGGSFYAPVTTSRNQFLESGVSYFQYPPALNWPEANFPVDLSGIENAASAQNYLFENENNAYQFRCIGDSSGWNWYKWEIDQEFDPENVVDQGFITYQENLALYFNGTLEIASESVNGTGSIACTQELRIIDNLKYEDVTLQELTIPEDSPNKYGYLCDGDILIMNTEANGRGNGANSGGGHDSAHVVLTGSFFAVDECFEIHQQNDAEDEWVYCRDVVPNSVDERGTIYLRGSLANKRRGYVHRSNCGGTGYDKDYSYDYRLIADPPPYFPEIEWDGVVITGDHTLDDQYIFLPSDNSIIVAGQGDLHLGDNLNITKEYEYYGEESVIKSYFGGRIYADATAENPTIINMFETEDHTLHIFGSDEAYDWGIGPVADDVWTGLQINGVNYLLPAHDNMQNCSFSGESIYFLPIHGNAATSRTISNCYFAGDIHLAEGGTDFYGYHLVEKSVFKGIIWGRIDLIDRCDFFPLDLERPGLLLNPEVETNVVNSFFKADNNRIQLNDNVFLDYCAYNTNDFQQPFSHMDNLGEYMLGEVDPMFVDYENGDYHLQQGSPLIDAGDPGSLLDPDGSIADIGAFYFHQLNAEEIRNELPSVFTVSQAYPNPFNSNTKVEFALPAGSDISYTIYNIFGEEVVSKGAEYYTAGRHTINLDFKDLSSGVYFLKLSNSTNMNFQKLIYVK